MKVCIVGTGYVGLVTGAGLAARGHDVVCVDLDDERVDLINSGGCPIHEEGLVELLDSVVGSTLTATTNLAQSVQDADCTMICVGTPFDEDSIDLGQIRAAAASIGAALRGRSSYHTVVVKSTVVPGTTEEVVGPIVEQASGRTIGESLGLGMNPEFLAEGVAVSDFMNPDRVVAGGIDERSQDQIAGLYRGFGDVPIVRTTPRTAELIKYTSNALLSTLISFSNEIANLASSIGVDAVEVMDAVHLDRRLSPVLADGRRVTPGVLAFLRGGCGFGGSCFGKDVRALISFGTEHGHAMPMLSSTIHINERQPVRMIELLRRRIPDLDGLDVTVLGLAFKPGTDDVRESPALTIAAMLVDEGANVTVYDPIAHTQARRVLGDRVSYAPDVESATEKAAAILLVTSWPEFRDLPELIAERSPQPVVIDGRRMLPRTSVSEYEGIGI